MRQRAVIAERDPQEAEKGESQNGDDDAGPAEKPRHEHQQAEYVNARNVDNVAPVDSHRLRRLGQVQTVRHGAIANAIGLRLTLGGGLSQWHTMAKRAIRLVA